MTVLRRGSPVPSARIQPFCSFFPSGKTSHLWLMSPLSRKSFAFTGAQRRFRCFRGQICSHCGCAAKAHFKAGSIKKNPPWGIYEWPVLPHRPILPCKTCHRHVLRRSTPPSHKSCRAPKKALPFWEGGGIGRKGEAIPARNCEQNGRGPG